MKIKDGKLVLEKRNCTWCDGKGVKEKKLKCSNYGIPRTATYKKPCTICGGRSKDSHGYLPTGIFETCTACNGNKLVDETIYDYTNHDMAQQFKIHLLRHPNRVMGFVEQHLSLRGSVYSIVDYGRCHQLSDEELISTVRGHCKTIQACKLVLDEYDLSILPLVIITGDQGYSVIKAPQKYIDTLKEKGFIK